MSIQRPFSVLGIQQVAVGGLDKIKLRKFWVDTLGLRYTGSFISETENVDEDICELGHGVFKVEVDLMQPIDATKKPKVTSQSLDNGAYFESVFILHHTAFLLF